MAEQEQTKTVRARVDLIYPGGQAKAGQVLDWPVITRRERETLDRLIASKAVEQVHPDAAKPASTRSRKRRNK